VVYYTPIILEFAKKKKILRTKRRTSGSRMEPEPFECTDWNPDAHQCHQKGSIFDPVLNQFSVCFKR